MGVNHRCRDVLMPQQFLYRPNIGPATQQMRRKTVSESVTGNVLQNLRPFNRFPQMLWESVKMQMVATKFTSPWVARQTRRRKQILPSQLTMRIRVLRCQRVR